MATPVILVATSRDETRAPIDRKKAYMVMVRKKSRSRLMKNWLGVRARPAMK